MCAYVYHGHLLPACLVMGPSLSLSFESKRTENTCMDQTTTQAQGTEAMAATTNSSSSGVDNDYSHGAIVKGKRTKRRIVRSSLRAPVPVAATASTSSSSASFSSAGAAGGMSEEEEDMANCLMLLAQGRALEEAGSKPETGILEGKFGGGAGFRPDVGGGRSERCTSRRLAETATMTNGKVSFYVYECKTCNKCFPSFQALGGHRSSHKKIKMTTLLAAEEKKPSEALGLCLGISAPYNTQSLPNRTNATGTQPAARNVINSSSSSIRDINNTTVSTAKQKVHDCSICGAEFSSGQALGGHMRRHRAEAPTVCHGGARKQLEPEAKEKSALPALDLNLPAPADDDRAGNLDGSPSFGFTRKRPLVFSPSSLVDCHY